MLRLSPHNPNCQTSDPITARPAPRHPPPSRPRDAAAGDICSAQPWRACGPPGSKTAHQPQFTFKAKCERTGTPAAMHPIAIDDGTSYHVCDHINGNRQRADLLYGRRHHQHRRNDAEADGNRQPHPATRMKLACLPDLSPYLNGRSSVGSVRRSLSTHVPAAK